jgi:hypothetical protein
VVARNYSSIAYYHILQIIAADAKLKVKSKGIAISVTGRGGP